MIGKIIINTLLSVGLLFSTVLSNFTDIPVGHWAVSYMENAYRKEWMTGESTSRFNPDGTLSRAQLVTLLHRFDGAKTVSNPVSFKDTDSNAWYGKALNWAVANNIIQGYQLSDGTYFKPDQAVSRQESATIFYRYAGKGLSSSYNLNNFIDADMISDFAREGLKWCAQNAIMSGKPTSSGMKADPTGISTRAECCKMLSVLETVLNGSSQNPTGSALSVKNGKLVDANNQPVLLKGISSHGLAWYGDLINQGNLVALKNLFGINAIRLAMYTQEYGGYCSGADQNSLKNQVLQDVRLARNLGLYTIVDWHILSDGNPLTYQQEAAEFFDSMSNILKDDEGVLYEICNEPNGGTSWQQIKEYAQKIIPVIRKNDPDAIVIVGTPEWSQRVDLAAQSPLDFENVLYSLHFYAATHHEDLFNKAQSALSNGLPMLISEFGLSEASGSGSLDENWGRKWLNWAHSNSIGTFAWSLSNKDESSALIAPSYNGQTSLQAGDLSNAGKMLQNLYGKEGSVNDDNSLNDKTDSSDQIFEGNNSGSSNIDSSLSYRSTLPEGLILSETGRESWKENNKEVVLIRLELKNESRKSLDPSVVLEFSDPVSIRQFWNCTATTFGRKITLQGPDWKKSLNPSESLQDIGLILEVL